MVNDGALQALVGLKEQGVRRMLPVPVVSVTDAYHRVGNGNLGQEEVGCATTSAH